MGAKTELCIWGIKCANFFKLQASRPQVERVYFYKLKFQLQKRYNNFLCKMK